MTCIVAIVDKETGKVMLGSDSLAGWNGRIFEEAESKIWKESKHDLEWVFGVSGLYRFAQIAQYEVGLPEESIEHGQIVSYLVKKWVPKLLSAAQAQSGATTKDGVIRNESSMLIGVSGKILTVDERFCISTCTESFSAIGSGGAVGYGVLASLEAVNSPLSTKERLELALKISSRSCPGVGGRFDFLST